MNWEIILSVTAALGGIEGLKWLYTRRSSRRIASAQAEEQEAQADSARERLYEETIQFLQTQLKEKEERFADLTAQLRKSTASELRLTRRLGESELRYATSRCDRLHCQHRLPPLFQQENRSDGDVAAEGAD